MDYARVSLLFKSLFLFSILLTLSEFNLQAQDNFAFKNEEPAFVYDEIPVLVMIEGAGTFNLDVLYTEKGVLYVNVEELFKTLKIQCLTSQKGDSIAGFIETESRTYLIDYNMGMIKVGAKTFNPRNGLVKESGILYVESSLMATAFGITLTFNFRTLSIILKSDFELPLIKLLRIEKLRSNILKLHGDVVADTVVMRNYHLFRFGTVDWSAASIQTWNRSTDYRFGLGIGAEFLYGEVDISANFYSRYKFDNRQVNYLWRWVDNDKHLIKQAQVGKISEQTISFINSPIIGAVIRNSPTTIRKAAGYYTINEFTEPNWTVELYINDVMVDFTKADALGLYIFKVPNVYGYNTMKLKFYGPMGEERTEERTINMPYTVMPSKDYEYSISAGILQDSSLSRFGKGELNYGVNRILTIGGGIEYLSSISNGPFIPFTKFTIQPYSKLTINGEYSYGVRARGLLNYYLRKDILLIIDYAKYKEGQLATRFNAQQELKTRISVPVRYKGISGYAKLDYNLLVYNTFKYSQANLMVSGYYQQFTANSSVQLNWINNNTSFITLDLSLSYRLKSGFVFRPSAQYNVSEGKLMSIKAAVEKRIPKGFFSVIYERNVLFNANIINVAFRYDLSFARFNTSVTHSKGYTATSESLQGSLAFGSGNRYIHTNSNASVSKGGIALYPFLDMNNNGIFDNGEQMVKISSVRIPGGKVIFSDKDSIVRIPDLIAFTNYMVEFADNDLDNISWRFKNKIYQVMIDPNQFKHIDIPIIVVGEVTGMVYMNKNNLLNGMGRILVNIYNTNNIKITQILSESDGYISYLGLEPGDYLAMVDSVQLNRLGFEVTPLNRKFTVKATKEGDIIEGIDFTVKLKSIDTSGNSHVSISTKDSTVTPHRPLAEKDTSYMIIHKVVEEEVLVLKDGYAIQLGAFKKRSNAQNLCKKLEKNLGKRFEIIDEGHLYKVITTELNDRKEVDENISVLRKAGITELWVIILKANQTKMVLIDKQDTIMKITDSGSNVSQRESRESVSTFKQHENRDTSGQGISANKEISKVVENNPGNIEPTISMQVEEFHKKWQVVRAQRKIASKLKLNSDIVQKWDYFFLIIPGFYTREETYQYYPKLAGLGYPKISLIEKR
jgi:hypothetical protein